MMTVVAAALIWREGRLMILRRPEGKPLAGYWETPGGKLEPGEAPETALARELFEETGAVVRAIRPRHAMTVPGEHGDLFILFYDTELVSGEPRSLEGGEIAWVLPSEMQDYNFLPSDRAFLATLASPPPKLTFITGGARSGKSSRAEAIAREYGDDVLYAATSQAFDDEMRARIKAHRAQRPASWTTHEGWRDLGPVIAKRKSGAVLLDCLTLLVTNVLLEHDIDWERPAQKSLALAEADIAREVDGVISGARQSGAHVIVVSNELGMGVVPASAMGRVFRDIAGRANQRLCAAADRAEFMVSGKPLTLK